MSTPIRRFTDEYSFLSNEYSANIRIDNLTYHSAEAAYQAQKTVPQDRQRFTCLNAWAAKSAGRCVPRRGAWDKEKDDIMKKVVMAKFGQNPVLCKALLETGDAFLLNGTAGDEYWGINLEKNRGENKLGIILMEVREELKVQKKEAESYKGVYYNQNFDVPFYEYMRETREKEGRDPSFSLETLTKSVISYIKDNRKDKEDMQKLLHLFFDEAYGITDDEISRITFTDKYGAFLCFPELERDIIRRMLIEGDVSFVRYDTNIPPVGIVIGNAEHSKHYPLLTMQKQCKSAFQYISETDREVAISDVQKTLTDLFLKDNHAYTRMVDWIRDNYMETGSQ